MQPPIICRDEDTAWIITRRIKAIEPIILRHPRNAARYATTILLRRWPKAEKTISKDLQAIREYIFLVDGPWPQAEATILNSNNIFMVIQYAKNNLGCRWPLGEKVILKKLRKSSCTSDELQAIVEYSSSLIHGRWGSLESFILKTNNAWICSQLLARYVRVVLHGRWAKAESKIMQNAELSKAYIEVCREINTSLE